MYRKNKNNAVFSLLEKAAFFMNSTHIIKIIMRKTLLGRCVKFSNDARNAYWVKVKNSTNINSW